MARFRWDFDGETAEELKERVEEKVLQLIVVKFKKAVPKETRIEDLGLDSLDVIELMIVVEDNFRLRPVYHFSHLFTVGDVVDHVMKYRPIE